MLDGKVALVTGASRGIGHAIAQALVAQGARVVGTSTSAAGAQHLSEALGGEAAGRVLDVRDPALDALDALGFEFLAQKPGVLPRIQVIGVVDFW